MSQSQIQQIIDALKSASGYGWDALVRQQVVVGYQELASSACLFITLAVLLIVSLRLYRHYRHNDEANVERRAKERSKSQNSYCSSADDLATEGFAIGSIFCSIAALILLCVVIFLTIDGVGHIVNPAGYAITQLLPRS